jgi:hypothetical protein
MVFNSGMRETNPDARLIAGLGGPSKVAKLIHLNSPGGPQRVQNWMTRGIPSAIKVKYPHIFMPELAQAHTNTAPAATETVANDAAHGTSGVVHA